MRRLKRLLAWLLTPWRWTPPEPVPIVVYGNFSEILMARWGKLHIGPTSREDAFIKAPPLDIKINVVDVGILKREPSQSPIPRP